MVEAKRHQEYKKERESTPWIPNAAPRSSFQLKYMKIVPTGFKNYLRTPFKYHMRPRELPKWPNGDQNGAKVPPRTPKAPLTGPPNEPKGPKVIPKACKRMPKGPPKCSKMHPWASLFRDPNLETLFSCPECVYIGNYHTKSTSPEIRHYTWVFRHHQGLFRHHQWLLRRVSNCC